MKCFPPGKAERASCSADAVGSLRKGQIGPQSAEMWLSPSEERRKRQESSHFLSKVCKVCGLCLASRVTASVQAKFK